MKRRLTGYYTPESSPAEANHLTKLGISCETTSRICACDNNVSLEHDGLSTTP